MKTIIFGIFAAAGIATSANASFGFSYEFSTDGGATYGHDRTVDVTGAPMEVQFRVIAYATPGTNVTTAMGPGPAVAFGRISGSEILTNWGAGSNGDVMGTQTRGAMPQGGAQYLLNSLSGGNTILGAPVAISFAANLLLSGQLAQYCPTSGGAPQYQWLIRTGKITVGQALGARTIEFHNNTRTTSTWYHDLLISGSQDVNTAQPDGDAIDFGGTLTVIPAPTTLAFTALAGVFGLRRRNTSAAVA